MNYSGTVAIVSHDRYFLDHLVNKVFELRDGKMNDYLGNYSYFIEKRAEMTANAVAGTGGARVAGNADSGLSLKDQKRLEAEERNRLSKVKNALKKELTTLEDHISALEAKKAASEKILCDPQTHRDPAKIKALTIELKTMEKDLASAYARWTEVAGKLEDPPL